MNKKSLIIFSIFFILIFYFNRFIIAQQTKPEHINNPFKILVININLHDYELDGYDYLQKTIENLIPNAEVKTMHYELITPEIITSFNPKAIILGGQNTPWTEYPQEKLEKIYRTIRGITIPLLGICGGHQLLALSYGGTVSPIRVIDVSLPGYAGCWREKGYLNIKNLKQNDPIFEGLKKEIIVFENHCEEVKNIPPDFELIAEGTDCKIQSIKHKEKPLYGVQFHPEGYNEFNQDGKVILQNFFTKVYNNGLFNERINH